MQALRALARQRDTSRRYHSDNRATAPLMSDTHAIREPVASLEGWISAAEPIASKLKNSRKKAA